MVKATLRNNSRKSDNALPKDTTCKLDAEKPKADQLSLNWGASLRTNFFPAGACGFGGSGLVTSDFSSLTFVEKVRAVSIYRRILLLATNHSASTFETWKNLCFVATWVATWDLLTGW